MHDRFAARKRDDESFTDLVDRLIDETTVDWRETFGRLPEEDAAELERVATRSRQATSEGLDDRRERAVEAFADHADDESRRDGA